MSGNLISLSLSSAPVSLCLVIKTERENLQEGWTALRVFYLSKIYFSNYEVVSLVPTLSS